MSRVYPYDPDAEAPGFAFNRYELQRWGILNLWGARDSGSAKERVSLRHRWLVESKAFVGWNERAWQTHSALSHRNYKPSSPPRPYGYVGLMLGPALRVAASICDAKGHGSSSFYWPKQRARRLNASVILDVYPELAERLERGGPKAVYQHAGCTPAETEAVSMLHDGHSSRDVGRLLGISHVAVLKRARGAEVKLRALRAELQGYHLSLTG